jgi:hypothetical protein
MPDPAPRSSWKGAVHTLFCIPDLIGAKEPYDEKVSLEPVFPQFFSFAAR